METTVKKREWVKNAAIVFLAVLLLLTFFSNTILNRSLPEVATQSIHGGSIMAQIRGTGTVTANQSYEVKIDQSRKVRSVMVREGQEVNAGDVLFVLSADSTELEEAEAQLRQLQRSYQTALINAAGSDYAQQNRDIALAREALAAAEAERDANVYDEAELTQAEKALEDAKAGVAEAEAGLEQVKAQLRSIGIYDELDAQTLLNLQRSVKEKEEAYNEAKNVLEAAKLKHQSRYNWVLAQAERLIKNTKEYKDLSVQEQPVYLEEKMPAYIEYVLYLIEKNGLALPTANTQYFSDHIENDPEDVQAYQGAYEAITAAQEAFDAAEEAYYSQNASLPEILAGAEPAMQALSDAQKKQDDAQKALDDLNDKKARYDAAVETVKTCQRALEDQLFSLQQQQKNDGRAAALTQLELQDLNDQIEKQQKLVDELADGSAENEIKADVGGIIGSVSITPGNTTTPGTALATIEIPDQGYLVSFSVSNDQARRVHTGDPASAANVYWGSQINAVLTGIRTDPQNPQNNKILTFEVTGDVTPGSSLTLTVGQRSAEYDYVVPNSALRSDSNGDFILVVTAKNSPLGDRYTATRVDVTKLAADDTSTAVTGALNEGDFVITTSTAPIKNGDRVRLAEDAG